jgi:hypothetical protein
MMSDQKLKSVEIVVVRPKMPDIKNSDFEKHNHLEDIELRYEQTTWSYMDSNISKTLYEIEAEPACKIRVERASQAQETCPSAIRRADLQQCLEPIQNALAQRRKLRKLLLVGPPGQAQLHQIVTLHNGGARKRLPLIIARSSKHVNGV